MKSIALLLTVTMISCASQSPGEAKRPAPRHVDSRRFLALGDSYTIGESVAPAERWPNQLARELRHRGVDVVDPEIIAKTGWTTDELSAAIDVANPQGLYGLVTLLIGVNNQFRGRDAEQYRGEFAALLKRAVGFAQGDPRHVIVVSIPDWGVMPYAAGRDRAAISRDINRYNAVNLEETTKAGARYVEITGLSRRAATDPSLGAADGLHPSPAMYALWVEAIVPEAQSVLTPPIDPRRR